MSLRLVSLVVLALALATTAGCDPASTPAAPPSAAPDEATAPEKGPAMLPAYALPGERGTPGKADQYDDFKNGNLDVYGITAPPSVTVRPAAEHEPAQALLLAYSSTGLPDEIKLNIVEIIAGAQDVVDIYVVYETSAAKSDLLSWLSSYGVSSSGISWLQYSLDSIWMRDFGPLSILDTSGSVGLVDARYYHYRVYDDAVPTLLGSDWSMTTYRMPVDMEGGNFMSGTDGKCYFTQALYSHNGASQALVDQYFQDYLGCTDLVVLGDMSGEGTGHIDMSTKLADDDTVILGEYETFEDYTNAGILDDNATILAAHGLDVVRIPMPSNADGNFRSYTNSLFVNQVNLWPTYDVDADKEADAALVYESVLPTYTHVPIDSSYIISWAGAIHCITMTVASGATTALEPDPPTICSTFDCYPTSYTSGCGDVTFQGYCDGTVLVWCQDDAVNQYDCAQIDKECGFVDSQTGYDCIDGGTCTPDCAGATCGDDGCGGSCGTCATGQACVSGQCVTDDCGDISYQGCCDGYVLTYCEGGQLVTVDCLAEHDTTNCGWWTDQGYYACGAVGQEPTGQYPLACPGTCTPDCTGKECGADGCGGSCGACPTGEACQAGVCVSTCVPDCAGKVCGNDGCGGSCGSCATGEACVEGSCTSSCTADCTGKECGDDGCGGTCGTCATGQVCGSDFVCQEPVDECQGVTYEGCCDGGVLYYCDIGQLKSQSCGTYGCGWWAQEGYYACGGNDEAPAEYSGTCPWVCVPDCSDAECGDDGCGGSCGSCPSGTECMKGSCESTCTVDCAGKVCGDNGCGGSCGTCATGTFCSEGQCVASCTPDCSSAQCGDDGCGGSCGACSQGESCVEGICTLPDACDGIDYAGLCDGNTLVWCENNQLFDLDCGAYGSYVCQYVDTYEGYYCVESDECVPACDGKECGDDGCGADCGKCDPSQVCNDAGKCVASCTPSCEGVSCGGDGCGGSCGTCGSDEECQAGTCVALCVPDCVGKACGGDGCGGSCGTCAAGSSCQDGTCVAGCVPLCDGEECGPDGCGGSCGTCEGGLVCDDGTCTDVCAPSCQGKTCGDDGCGGLCGECPKEWTCEAGQCVETPNACGSIPATGTCVGAVLTWCAAGVVMEKDCAALDAFCVFDAESGVYVCQEKSACEPQCEGKECGPDGCGGTCGLCGSTESCVDGTCQTGCTPSCEGKECGSDGCDGTCGTCGPGQTCADFTCVGTCTADCAGKVCGDDGCGGSCGACDDGLVCEEGACVETTESCPAGYHLDGGVCVVDGGDTDTTGDPVPGDDVSGGGSSSSEESGCAMTREASSHGTPWLLVLFVGLAALVVTRRRRAPTATIARHGGDR